MNPARSRRRCFSRPGGSGTICLRRQIVFDLIPSFTPNKPLLPGPRAALPGSEAPLMKTPGILIFSTLACAGLQAQWGGELRFCLHGEPKTLNPVMVDDD